MMTLDDLQYALKNPNVKAFLRVIRQGESNQENSAYTLINGGSHFTSFVDHPFGRLPTTKGGKAAGAYQHLPSTWGDFVDWAAQQGSKVDFTPLYQDLGGVWCIAKRSALKDVLAGRFQQAVAKCRPEWTSLPGASENSGRYTMVKAEDLYKRFGGQLETVVASTPVPVPVPVAPGGVMSGEGSGSDTEAGGSASTSAPISSSTVGAAINVGLNILKVINPMAGMIAELFPKIAGLVMDKAKTVPERNVGLVTEILNTIQKATGAPSHIEALAAVASDPQAKATADTALAPYYAMVEAGGGGIEGARKADLDFVRSSDTIWRSPSFVIGLMLMPIVYMITVSITLKFDWLAEWNAEARSGLANLMVGMILGGLIGYYYGQITSRNRVTPGGQ
jgi:muramidase (phage lysozyme)